MTKKEAMPYMKLYKTYLDDIDFLELDRATRSLYMDFYLLAWNADAGGDLISRETGRPLTVRNLALRLRDDPQTIADGLKKLAAAGFISKTGDTWRILRYCEEQENQSEMRKSWTDRQSKHRSKTNEDNQEASQENEKELKGNESLTQSNQIKLKSHAPVTRDSRVTPAGDGRDDRRDDRREEEIRDDRPQASAPAPAKPRQPVLDPARDMHPLLSDLVMFWHVRTGEHISHYSQRLINTKLFEGWDPLLLRDKIDMTARYEPNNLDAYFSTCLKSEELFQADPDQQG